jgi:hypothetical protein
MVMFFRCVVFLGLGSTQFDNTKELLKLNHLTLVIVNQVYQLGDLLSVVNQTQGDQRIL